jgi:hypothetical protein
MATLQQLQARLEALKKARDSGALMVRHGDTSTQFRTLAEMNQIIANLEGEIADQSTERKSVRAVRLFTRSGW